MLHLISTKYGTNPLILHATGNTFDKPAWIPLKALSLNQPIVKLPVPRNLDVLTYNTGKRCSVSVYTDEDKPLGVAEESLRRMGAYPHVLCQGYTREDINWIKIVQTLGFLQTSKADYILVVDSADVLFFAPLEYIVDRFQQEFESKGIMMLFNAHNYQMPQTMVDTPLIREERCFLNAGCYIARREFLLQVLPKCDYESKTVEDLIARKQIEQFQAGMDQVQFRILFNRFYPTINVDTHCKLFYILDYNARFQFLELWNGTHTILVD